MIVGEHLNKKGVMEKFDNGFNVRDEYKHLDVDALKDIQKKESLPFTICALNVEGDLNIGMMARTASMLGCETFYIYGRRKIDRRSLVGAQNYLPIERISGLDKDGNLDITKLYELFHSTNVFPIFVEQGGESLLNSSLWNDIYSSSWTYFKPCFVFGNESTGMPDELLDTTKLYGLPVVSVPQMGVLRSYNVASAMSMVIWDWFKWHMNKITT